MMREVGQLFFTGVSGLSLTDEEKEFIEKNSIGGVILFDNNYDSPAQLAELVNSIQQLRKEYPLFIAVDHEGGRVNRFRRNFTHFPSMQDVALLDSPKICFNIHKVMAEELSACGINLNLSPCCDILTNSSNKAIGDRSFGDTEEVVSKFTSAAIRGLMTNGVMACAKHFPGHGSTSKDSHNDLPYIKTTIEDLKNSEFQPFIKAIKSRVDFVMMGHLVVDSIDQDNPATLSPKAYKILRDEFKYTKIILTDDMEMGAISNSVSVQDAAVKALKAGADMLIYKNFSTAKEAYTAVNEAVKIKQLKNSDLDLKLERVFSCKKHYFKDFKPVYIPKIVSKINAPASQILLKEIQKLIAEKKDQA